MGHQVKVRVGLQELEQMVINHPGYVYNLINEGVTVSGNEMLAKVQLAISKGVPMVYFLNRIQVVTNSAITSLYTFLTTNVAKEVLAIRA